MNEQYIAVTSITRNPVIEAGSIVPVGDGEGDVKPEDIPIYLAAGVIRKRTPKPQPAVEETAETRSKTRTRGRE